MNLVDKDFEKKIKEVMEEEFLDIKATSQFKINVINKTKSSLSFKNILKKIWNFELELDLRICAVICILVIFIPSVLIFEKTKEIEDNRAKIYEDINKK